MFGLNPSMRLKVKADTFFLPDSHGGVVYFHNNQGSFQMEGRTIHQWIEKLMPVFNGEHTLDYLTDGLPDEYRKRVYEIAEVLYRNGFVRDVSQDRPHQLTEEICHRYASQIAFLDNFADSPAFRFQSYRQTQVLVAGSGSFLVSLVTALLESGLPNLHVLVTESVPTNRQRLFEVAAHARKTDPEVALSEVQPAGDWQEVVRPFHSVLYVSQEEDVEELRALQAACKQEQKVFLPALRVQQAGLAGPLVRPDSDGCWESAWRRIHQTALSKNPQLHTFSATAGAMLANVMVFEWFKTVTGVSESERKNQFFLLNLETLEGNWHPFMPHPTVTGPRATDWVENLNERLVRCSNRRAPNRLLPYFSQLTSAESGIFHVWEEGDLRQLPLAQCRVQAVDPLAEGPAPLLPDFVCTGLTHEEARREAGLAGIEAYVTRMVARFGPPHLSRPEAVCTAGQPQDFVGVGAGETVAEAVSRGLYKCLAGELTRQTGHQTPSVLQVHLNRLEDERCQYYLQALTTMQGTPQIGLGQEVAGLPVVWVGAHGRWYGSVGLNLTSALRRALQRALMAGTRQTGGMTTGVLEVSAVLLEAKVPQSVEISAYNDVVEPEVLQSALHSLERNRKRLLVHDLAMEPFLTEELAAVCGVILQEEGSR